MCRLRSPGHLTQIDTFLCHLVQRRQLAQFPYCFDHADCYIIDLFFRVEPAETESDGSVGQIVADTERLENVAGLERGRGASRSARYRDVVDAHQKALAFDVGETDIQVVGEAML